MVLRMIVAGGCVIASPAQAQEPDPASRRSIEGEWAGAVALPVGELPFSVTFEQAGGVLSATMDIPAQGAMGLPLIAVSYVDGRVHFELDSPIGRAVWDGAHAGDRIEGEFTQGGLTTTFSASRAGAGEPEAEEPLPSGVEEVSFQNGETHLEGTLTLPEGAGPFPGVVLITGSGPQDRDQVVFGFPVFRVLSDGNYRLDLTRAPDHVTFHVR